MKHCTNSLNSGKGAVINCVNSLNSGKGAVINC